MSDYDPIPLARMIGTTELAVIARVTAVRDDDLTLAVERRLRGTVGDQLLMAKFVPSKFDSPRAAPYTEGQQFVLFLTRPDAQVDRWRVRGLGGEGAASNSRRVLPYCFRRNGREPPQAPKYLKSLVGPARFELATS